MENFSFVKSTVDEIENAWKKGQPLMVGSWRVSSVFQPVFSVCENKLVLHESLLRSETADGSRVSPITVLSHERELLARLMNDRWLRIMHLWSWKKVGGEGVVSLNVLPENVMTLDGELDFVMECCEYMGIAPASVCLEIPEALIRDDEVLRTFCLYAKRYGFMVAFDNFASYEFRLDRVWRCRPDIVKIDRVFVKESLSLPHAALKRLINSLSDFGVSSLVQGVETMNEALAFMSAGVDMVQGFYFEYPSQHPYQNSFIPPMLPNLWSVVVSKSLDKGSLLPPNLLDALHRVSSGLSKGKDGKGLLDSLSGIGASSAMNCLDDGSRQEMSLKGVSIAQGKLKSNWSFVEGFDLAKNSRGVPVIRKGRYSPVSLKRVRMVFLGYSGEKSGVLIVEFPEDTFRQAI